MGNNTKEFFIKKIYIIIQSVFIALVIILMMMRLKYGIDFTDESWYVAETYVVSKAWSLPFVNNISQAPCASFPVAVFWWIRNVFVDNTDGIVLFSRRIYLLIGVSINILTIYIMNRFSEVRVPIISIALMLVAENSYSLFDINYNTIGLIYSPLVIATCFAEFETRKLNDLMWGGLTGIIATRMILGCPQSVVIIVTLFMICLLNHKINRLLGIVVGGMLVFLTVFVWMYKNGGFYGIHCWFEMFINQGYFDIVSQTNQQYTIHALIVLVVPIVAFGVMFWVIKELSGNKDERNILNAIILLVILISTYYFVKHRNTLNFNNLTLRIWFFSLILIYKQKSVILKNFGIVSVAYFILYLFASFANIWGFESQREYWLWYPVIITLIIIYNYRIVGKFGDGVETFKIPCILLCMLLCIMKLSNNMLYVYRDDSIKELKTCVKEGIWKGIYTTEERAESVETLENYIRKITKNDDRVLFLDWVSFGYIMSNGRMCSPSTLDISYSYDVNTPDIYLRYFVAEDEIPTKIIYIDYGRDDKLSIEDSDWAFNDFLLYYVNDDEYRNEMFRVKTYSLDNEFEAWEYLRALMYS